jgi:hypothetical protein
MMNGALFFQYCLAVGYEYYLVLDLLDYRLNDGCIGFTVTSPDPVLHLEAPLLSYLSRVRGRSLMN